MAIFQTPPILTLASLSDHLPDEQFQSHGGALWLCGANQSPIQSTIGKSIDGGATWTEQDAAHAWQDISGRFYYLFDRTADTIHIFLRASGAFTLQYTPFDMATGLYGAMVDSGIQTGTQIQAVQRSSGDIVIFARENLSPTANLEYFVLSAGVFSGPTTMIAAPAGVLLLPACAAINSSTDLAWLAYVYDVTGSINVAYYAVSLSLAGAVGAPVLIDPGGLTGAAILGFSRGLYWPLKDQIILPRVRNVGASAGVFIGSPSSVPVWSQIEASLSLPNTWQMSDCSAFLDSTGTTLYLVWTASFFPGIVRVYIASSADGVTFSAPQLYWDVIANPGVAGLPVADYDVEAPLLIVTPTLFQMVAQSEFNSDQASAFFFLAAPLAILPVKRCLLP